VIAPGVYDALGARMAEVAGFKAVYMSGFAVTASLLARPDIGLLTMSEMVGQAANIVNAVNVPVIADADTGYGGLPNVERTVIEYERRGVSAIHIEDQVSPKRCGHLAGVKLIGKAQMEKKLKCALAARSTPEFLIIGRTDAFRCLGIAEAIERAKRYADAGADIIWVDGLSDPSDYERISKSISVPKMAAIVEVDAPAKVNARQLKDMGFSVVIFPLSGLLAAAHTLSRAMREIMESGASEKLHEEMIGYSEFNRLMGVERFRA